MFYCKCSSYWRLIVWLTMLSGPVSANGVIGKTYPIAEKDLLSEISQKLERKREQGEIDRLGESVKRKTLMYLKRPSAVENITAVKTPSTRYYDPSITVPYDIRDEQGRVIHPAGTTVNPLEYRDLQHRLIFFNSDDTKQVDWVKRLTRDSGTSYKLILVAGSPTKTMKALKTRVLFDQQGFLADKLGIVDVPTIVYQEGKRLRIDRVISW